MKKLNLTMMIHYRRLLLKSRKGIMKILYQSLIMILRMMEH